RSGKVGWGRKMGGRPLPGCRGEGGGGPRAKEPRQNGGRDIGLTEATEREHAVADTGRDRDDARGNAARQLTANRRASGRSHVGADRNTGARTAGPRNGRGPPPSPHPPPPTRP